LSINRRTVGVERGMRKERREKEEGDEEGYFWVR
jgi:hypothetical protein